MPLEEAIRQHLILASEARNKAGPQWRLGAPGAAEDMPPEWSHRLEIASRHEAEADRLRGKLAEARSRHPAA